MDARRARSRHEAELMGLPGVTGVGTGRDEQTGEEVVVVFVTRDTPRDRLAKPDLIRCPALLSGPSGSPAGPGRTYRGSGRRARRGAAPGGARRWG
ncbi:hypothetical protein SFUMM280S_04745 [Streptomyces fumanus]